MNAPEKVYRDDLRGNYWLTPIGDGTGTEYIRADIHEAEMDALEADLAASIAVREEMQLGGNRMTESLRFARDDADALKAENEELLDRLAAIHDMAHDKSTGPAVEDSYWAIRALAGKALGIK